MKLQEEMDKEHNKLTGDMTRKLDTLARGIENLSESLARVHHLLAIRALVDPATIPVPAPGGPPPPPPPPPPPHFAKSMPTSPSPGSRKMNESEGFGAVLNQLKSQDPKKRLKKTSSRFSVPQSPSGSETSGSGETTDSD